MAMGHEYCGVVVEVGSEVKTVKPGQFVVGSFVLSDNTCPHCRYGFHSSCEQREFMTGGQAELARVPLADGTLLATSELPPDDLIPSLLAASDVLGTGWYAADAARVQLGSTVVVVGDGAVGLMGVLAAKQMGAAPDYRHEPPQDASGPGARVWRHRHRLGARRRGHCTDQGDDAACRRRCGARMCRYAGIDEAGARMRKARFDDRLCRGCRMASNSTDRQLFFSQRGLMGGPAPVRRFLPHLLDLILTRQINPGKCSILNCRWRRPPKAIALWTNGGPSRRCSGPRNNSPLPGEQKDGALERKALT